jgi:hypothetical protein
VNTQLELHPEGTGEIPHDCAPPSTGRTPAVPGEEFPEILIQLGLSRRPGDIPVGFCQCGCGAKTPIARRTYAKDHVFAGKPLRFIRGHQRTLRDPCVEVRDCGYTTPCWVWVRNLVEGYAFVNRNEFTTALVHRIVWEAVNGPVPDRLTLDHLCRNRACVNPDHLEPVTNAANVLRGEGPPAKNARKTHCKRGHPFDEANTHISARGERICKACRKNRGNPEPLTFPTDKATASQFAIGWRRRGFNVELEQRGRHWVVTEVEE